MLETAWVVVKPHRFLNRSWVYGLVTYFLQIFSKKKKKKKELVIYLLVITGSLNCQSRLLTNLTPFLYCKQLTIARSLFWSEGSLTVVVMFVVKKRDCERERVLRKEKSESVRRSRWVLRLWEGAGGGFMFILAKNTKSFGKCGNRFKNNIVLYVNLSNKTFLLGRVSGL